MNFFWFENCCCSCVHNLAMRDQFGLLCRHNCLPSSRTLFKQSNRPRWNRKSTQASSMRMAIKFDFLSRAVSFSHYITLICFGVFTGAFLWSYNNNISVKEFVKSLLIVQQEKGFTVHVSCMLYPQARARLGDNGTVVMKFRIVKFVL